MGKIQQEFGSQGVKVVAVNIQPYDGLGQWRAYWRSLGAADVVWANDTQTGDAVTSFEVAYLGTTILIDREGRIAWRSVAPPYEALRSEVEKAL